jgi:hypothetical protein
VNAGSSKDDVDMLRFFDRRILRRIFGPIEENGKWRST